MRWIVITLAVIGLLAMANGVRAEESNKTLSRTEINDRWAVSVHVGEVTNIFSHCVVTTFYQAGNAKSRKLMRGDGMVLFLKGLRNGEVEFEIASTDWNLTQDKQYNIKLDFDTQWFKVTAFGSVHAKGPNGQPGGASFVSPIGKEHIDQFITNFSTSKNVEISVNGSTMGTFPLDGSAAAAKSLLKCVTEQIVAARKTMPWADGSVINPDTRNVDDTFR